jgi:hypothetical protein
MHSADQEGRSYPRPANDLPPAEANLLERLWRSFLISASLLLLVAAKSGALIAFAAAAAFISIATSLDRFRDAQVDAQANPDVSARG